MVARQRKQTPPAGHDIKRRLPGGHVRRATRHVDKVYRQRDVESKKTRYGKQAPFPSSFPNYKNTCLLAPSNGILMKM